MWLSGKKYGDCPECGYLQIDETLLPGPGAERERYLLHDNDPGEPRYRAYLERFVETAIAPFLSPGERILDFGSGPVPALGTILRGYGYSVRCWDPFFAPEPGWEDELWDAIVLHEVAEHLHSPAATFRTIAGRVREGGFIAARTRFRPEDPTSLESWWYLGDSTHVGFFAPRSFAALAEALDFSLSLCLRPDIVVLKARHACAPLGLRV